MRPREIVERYHRSTDILSSGAFRHTEYLLDYTHDPANVALEFKDYEGAPRVDLPAVDPPAGTLPAVTTLSGKTPEPRRMGVTDLARILCYSGGVTKIIERAPGIGARRGERPRYTRASSSAHSYPDMYVVCQDMPGLAAGLYYFHPLTLGLSRLREGDHRGWLAEAAADPNLARRPASVVLAGVPWRAAWRYRERALRHTYWDVGSLLANIVAIAEASGIPSQIVLGFVDAEVARLIGTDQVHQFPIAIVGIGLEAEPPANPPARDKVALSEPRLATKQPVLFPLVRAAHRAGDLQREPAVKRWRGDRSVEESNPATFEVETPNDAPLETVEEVILRRGSTRRMRDEAVPREALEWAVAVACRSMPSDWPEEGRGLLQHFVVVHRVEGVERGLYRWAPSGLELRRTGDFRSEAQFVSMSQGQAGDGAYVTFHCADLQQVLRQLGPRGYRAVQIEAGWTLERLHLAVYALHVGATGLAFFDDEVARLLDASASPMIEVAVGLPAYRARKGELGPRAPVIAGKAIDMALERTAELRERRTART